MKTFILSALVACISFAANAQTKPPRQIHDKNIAFDGPSLEERNETAIKNFMTFMRWDDTTKHIKSGRSMRGLVNLMFKKREARTFINDVVKFASEDDYLNATEARKRAGVFKARVLFNDLLNKYALHGLLIPDNPFLQQTKSCESAFTKQRWQ